MKISDIVGQISNGLAKSNRFTVNLTPPSIVSYYMSGQGAGSTDYIANTSNLNFTSAGYRGLQKLLLLCDSAQLPGVNLNTAPTRTFGEVREIPYEVDYEPITLTFYVDADMNVKKLFDTWMLSTQVGDSRNFSYYDSYTTKLSIYVQDMQENNRYIVDLYEVYPKTVGPVQVDFSNKDVMKLQVTMMYKYWRSSQVAYVVQDAQPKPEFFDYTTNVDLEQYNNNFISFQQKYNTLFGVPESLGNSTGTTTITL